MGTAAFNVPLNTL